MTFVFYHSKCGDGLLACSIAFRALSGNIITKAIDADSNQEPFWKIDFVQHLKSANIKMLYFLDVAPNPDIFDILMSSFDVMILDHHKCNEQKFINRFGSLPKNFVFDETKAGCKLAFEHFYPQETTIPLIVELVEKEDLAKQDLLTRQFIAEFYKPKYMTLECILPFLNDDKKTLDLINYEGKKSYLNQKQRIKEIVQNEVYQFQYKGNVESNVPICYYEGKQEESHFVSAIGAKMAKRFKPVLAIVKKPGLSHYSVRSNEQSVMTAFEFASSFFNGGGHQHASRFVSDKFCPIC